MSDERIDRLYDWAMSIDVGEMNHYLNYSGSRLTPMELLRVTWRVTPRGTSPGKIPQPAKTYEDFWYLQGSPVGCRRYQRLNIEPDRSGVIIVQPGTPSSQTRAVANAIVRLVLDMELQNVVVADVQVPRDIYDQLVNFDLPYFDFLPNMKQLSGPQLSIHLVSSTGGKSGYYYYQQQN